MFLQVSPRKRQREREGLRHSYREEECLSVALAFSLLALLLFATGVNIATLVAHFWQRAELAAPGGDPPPPRGAGRGHRRARPALAQYLRLGARAGPVPSLEAERGHGAGGNTWW